MTLTVETEKILSRVLHLPVKFLAINTPRLQFPDSSRVLSINPSISVQLKGWGSTTYSPDRDMDLVPIW